ncbi:hypothetical protein BV091_00614 [Haemophilus influenzae]|nr:hypothetical protein BV143_00200 [Haemophilus influenzae]PRK91642.1 hypothetical protein BV142_01070 [Haemophilus influenzae]PRL41082.1 hypothetical protein BV091_00614 [Haemophilus influenzae]PRL44584.1 hypothetical protein BV090_00188 [Haemophilus influenzae]
MLELAWVVKLSVAVTLTILPEIVPLMSPDWLEVVTLSVPLIVEPAWVVNLPDSAVKVAVLPVIFATLSLPALAVTVTESFSATTLPIIEPD